MDRLTFGQWLKSQREGRGLTLRDVERITGGRVSNAAVSQIETGKIANPTILVLHSIASALALDFGEVCERASVGNRPPAEPCPHCGQFLRQALQEDSHG